MKVVLTGGAGFLGRAVAAALAPDHKVYSLSRRGLAPRGAQGLVGDILDVDSLARGFDGARVVVHLAGQVSHSQAMGARLMKIHVDGTENVVAAARLAGVQRLIHMSTSGTVAVSSRADFMGTEESRRPLQLISRWGYYRSKLFAEEAALSANGADLEVISLNPSLLLGPGDDVEGESTRSVRLFLDDGMPLTPPGTVSVVDVRDVAQAVRTVLRGGKPGHRYLLHSANLSFFDFFARLARISGRSAPMAALPSAFRSLLSAVPELGKEDGFGLRHKISREEMDLACHHWSVDSHKARHDLRWSPRDVNETLEDTVYDLRPELSPAARLLA
jgi:dihydroflavonol-4-reductase